MKALIIRCLKRTATGFSQRHIRQNRDFAIAVANKIQKALTGLNNKAIVSHSFAGNVAVTAYEDGTKIYVNYNNTDVTVDNITVKARDFLRV